MIKTSLRNDTAGVTDMRRMSEKGEDLYTRWAKIRYESWKKSSILAQANAECEVRSQIESCFNVSLESIIDACRMINELTTVNSHYAVIRTAVEASATGVWLSTVGKKRKMIFYSIKLSYRDNENMLSLAEQSPTPNRALIDNRRQKKGTPRRAKTTSQRIRNQRHQDIPAIHADSENGGRTDPAAQNVYRGHGLENLQQPGTWITRQCDRAGRSNSNGSWRRTHRGSRNKTEPPPIIPLPEPGSGKLRTDT